VASEVWDAVVIGSGFGGSVTAHRLAREGWKVLLLERGRPYPPGSFPRTPMTLAAGTWDPSERRYGMFDLWRFSDVNAVVASGLGGGSLIYANVLLRKPHETFGPAWPVSLEELEPHYEAVEAILEPVEYPRAYEAITPKNAAMQEAAAALGHEWERSPLAVTFAGAPDVAAVPGAPLPDDPDNLFGLPRTTCRLCGECDFGCNFGAKNTLDHTYLSRAHATGNLTLRTLCEATRIRPVDDGDGRYAVTYRQHVAARDGIDERLLHPDEQPVVTVRARRVVVSAGTIGTNHLLARNRADLPNLSGRLGDGFSTNGDLLSFAWDVRQADGEPRYLKMATGPVITGTIRATRHGRMLQVQDAGVPAIGEWLFHVFDLRRNAVTATRALARFAWRKLRGNPDTNIGSEASELIGASERSAAMLPLLGMGQDTPGGAFRLDGEDLELSWSEDGSREFFDDLMADSRAIAEQLGGTFKDVRLAHIITVHALGGCAMATGSYAGVVDPTGECFGHEGLHVADGSVMPGPVGPNPSLTIAAVADRFADAMIAKGP
jgi:cholesterol oxidase